MLRCGVALPNGAVGCRILDGVVVVVAVEERRFARTIKVGAGADSGGRLTNSKLLKVAGSGRGVAPTCNTVLTPGCGVTRKRGEWWSVAASGGRREA